MNPTIDLIMHRRSTRKYDSTPLTQEEKDTILHAAMRAPTAGAMMLYTIIQVEDQSIKDRLAETCDHQLFIADAPYVLLFLADYQRWWDLYEAAGCEGRANELRITPRKPAEGDLVLALMDALIAAQTAALAAESLGIGSCYIGDIVENAEVHRQMFDLPRYTFPAALLCFGKPDAPPREPQVPRFDRMFIVHTDKYRRFSKEELNDLHMPFGRHSFDSGDFANGAQNIAQANYIRKFTADFSIEMTRSAREMIQRWVGE
jgi:FMN reductase (NADPH)/FMN reductase [NAD(P)H]